MSGWDSAVTGIYTCTCVTYNLFSVTIMILSSAPAANNNNRKRKLEQKTPVTETGMYTVLHPSI